MIWDMEILTCFHCICFLGLFFLWFLKKEINTFLVAFIVFVIYESFYSRYGSVLWLYSACFIFCSKTNLKKCFFNKYILLSYPFVILFFLLLFCLMNQVFFYS